MTKGAPSFHCHIASLDSGSSPDSFATREKELNTGYITTTDHGSLASCRTIFDLAVKHELKPILGMEGYYSDPNDSICKEPYYKYGHFTMHFLDLDAYHKAVKLVSNAPRERHGSEKKPLFNWQNIEELAGLNTTWGSGCLVGVLGRHLINDQPDNALKFWDKYRAVIPKDKLYVELFPHKADKYWVKGVFLHLMDDSGNVTTQKVHLDKNLRTNIKELKAHELAREYNLSNNKHTHLVAQKDYRTWVDKPAKLIKVEDLEDFLPNPCTPFCPDGDMQLAMNKWMYDLAHKYDIPIVISGDEHLATAEDKPVQDVRLMASGGSWRFQYPYYRQTNEEYHRYFKDVMGLQPKEIDGFIANNYGWASQFNDFKWPVKPQLPTKFYPADTLKYLYELINKHGRMQWGNQVYEDRLKEEIELFHRNGTIDLLPYFFLAEQVCDRYAQNGKITGSGRGSSGGVLLSYLLSITHRDPIIENMSLNRFITLDRIRSGKLPDIDMDFGSRDLLTEEITEDFFELTLDDGTIHEVPRNAKVLTTEGWFPVTTVFEKGMILAENFQYTTEDENQSVVAGTHIP